MAAAIPGTIEDYGSSEVRAKINSALNQIKWALAYMREVQEVKLPAAMHMLAAVKQLRRFASSLERVVDEAALAEMQMEQVEYFAGEGFEAVLHQGGHRVEWQHESVLNELCDRFVSSHRDRFPDMPERTLRRVAQAAMEEVSAAGRVEWRSTSLRAQGIDPDEFSVKVPGAASVQLTGQASYADRPSQRQVVCHDR